MSGLEIAGGQLTAASFRGQYLNYQGFDDVEFRRCDFRHVDAKLATFQDCTFIDCQFDNGNFQLTKFIRCRFEATKDMLRVQNASFGSAIFDECSLFERGACNFTECSFRSARIRRCKLGSLSFRTSSVESAEMYRCQIEHLDIGFTSCTGFIFAENKVNKVVFSTPTFFLIVGGWNLLDAQTPILRNTISGEITVDVTESAEIRRVLLEHLSDELEKRNSIWRIASGLVSLNYHHEDATHSLVSIVPQIINEASHAEISEDQLLDEMILIIRMLFLVELYAPAFSAFLERIKNAFSGASGKIHPHVWREFLSLSSQYRSATDRVFSIRLVFGKLSSRNPEHIAAAAAISSAFGALVSSSSGNDDIQIGEGSILLEILATLDDIPWWIAVVMAVGLGSKITVNFDVNKMFTQIGAALASLRKSKVEETRRLQESVSKHEIQIVITNVFLEISMQPKQVDLQNQISLQGKPGEIGIQLVAREPDGNSS